MFKVSFKENPKFPVKKVQRFNDGKITIVTITGVAELPQFLQCFIPPKIYDWMENCKNVQAYLTMTKMHLTIKGKARRNEDDGDTDNPILGERIAEARAKINLYKFMRTLTDKLYEQYCRLLSPVTTTKGYADTDTIMGANLKYSNLYNREEAHLRYLLAHEPDTESSQKH